MRTLSRAIPAKALPADDRSPLSPRTGSPELEVQRVHEDGSVVVTTGEGRGVSVEHGPFRFAFNDLFTFRDGLIARVDSSIVSLP